MKDVDVVSAAGYRAETSWFSVDQNFEMSLDTSLDYYDYLNDDSSLIFFNRYSKKDSIFPNFNNLSFFFPLGKVSRTCAGGITSSAQTAAAAMSIYVATPSTPARLLRFSAFIHKGLKFSKCELCRMWMRSRPLTSLTKPTKVL